MMTTDALAAVFGYRISVTDAAGHRSRSTSCSRRGRRGSAGSSCAPGRPSFHFGTCEMSQGDEPARRPSNHRASPPPSVPADSCVTALHSKRISSRKTKRTRCRSTTSASSRAAASVPEVTFAARPSFAAVRSARAPSRKSTVPWFGSNDASNLCDQCLQSCWR
jgi:hypothetical protein